VYKLEDFEEYTLKKYIGDSTVFVWSKQNGYQFLDFKARCHAIAEGLDFKIVGVRK
jgi:hypothetical protein